MNIIKKQTQCLYNQKLSCPSIPQKQRTARSLLPSLTSPGLAPYICDGSLRTTKTWRHFFLIWGHMYHPHRIRTTPELAIKVLVPQYSDSCYQFRIWWLFPSLWQCMTCCGAGERLCIITEITGDMVALLFPIQQMDFVHKLISLPRNVRYFRINWH